MKAVLGSHRRPRRVGLPSFPPLQGILDPGPTVSAIPQTWPARNSPHGLRKYFIPTTFETLLSYPIGFSVDINYLGGPAGIKYLVSFFFMLFGAMCDTCHVLAGYKILGLFFSRKPRGTRNGHWSGEEKFMRLRKFCRFPRFRWRALTKYFIPPSGISA